MPRRSAADSAARWVRAMQGAQQNYTEGVQAVQTAPGQAAARNVAGYQNGVAQAVASGKWTRNVAAVSLESWKDSAVNKGAARLSQGATAAQSKVQAAHERIGPMIDSAVQSISNMPRDNTANRIARATAYMTKMSQLANGNRR
jgi:hypothetical protein